MKNNQVKLTSDELAEILALNNEYQEILINLGQINLRRDTLKREEESLQTAETEHYNSYDETQKKEIPPPSEQAQTAEAVWRQLQNK